MAQERVRSRDRLGPIVRAFACAALSLAAILTPALAAPEPSPVPKRWQLKAEMGPLRLATVLLSNGLTKSYYYLTYTVTNNSGEDLLFAPAFDLSTDGGTLIRSGRGVPVEVTRSILDSLANPLLQDQISILGTLLQGAENAKEGLVIWPADDLEVDMVSVYGAGFSGETATLNIPDPVSGQVAKVVLRKTLMLRYHVPGEVHGRGSVPFPVGEAQWIMR